MGSSERRFEGKVTLVTGGASGIGRATCIRLAEEGAQVFATEDNSAGLAETEAVVKDAGGAIQAGIFDVALRASCFESVQAAVDAFGRLDVLANVAGIVRFAHTHEMSEEDWNITLAVNLSGPFFMSQAAIPHLLETEGNIVNIASNAGLMGQAYTAAYCATKAGIANLTRALAMEYMKQPIRINAIAPAGTKTAIATGVDFPADIDMDLMKRYSGMRGLSEPADIAAAIAYIASDDAKRVHGSIFSIDGGVTAG